jgi:1-pyrroline-5-carboxylate dehydrogenase
LLDLVVQIRAGDVRDFRNFMNAVIDKASFDNTTRYIGRRCARAQTHPH